MPSWTARCTCAWCTLGSCLSCWKSRTSAGFPGPPTRGRSPRPREPNQVSGPPGGPIRARGLRSWQRRSRTSLLEAAWRPRRRAPGAAAAVPGRIPMAGRCPTAAPRTRTPPTCTAASSGLRRTCTALGSCCFSSSRAAARLRDSSVRAGEWPVSSAAALLGIAMACTEPRPRHRPDLRFHVLPKLTVLARKASPWLPAPPGPVSFGAGLPSERASLCPILREPMQDPVVAADGYTYERRAIQRWFDEMAASGKPLASPMTGLPLPSTALTPARGSGPPPSGPRAPAGAEGLKDA
uniref:U-box domain-containing protein 35-like n=1 Tax=Tetraselmis sp. GSL018 TaxID=582737 RepID=A0A061RL00_9CHLO